MQYLDAAEVEIRILAVTCIRQLKLSLLLLLTAFKLTEDKHIVLTQGHFFLRGRGRRGGLLRGCGGGFQGGVGQENTHTQAQHQNDAVKQVQLEPEFLIHD